MVHNYIDIIQKIIYQHINTKSIPGMFSMIKDYFKHSIFHRINQVGYYIQVKIFPFTGDGILKRIDVFKLSPFTVNALHKQRPNILNRIKIRRERGPLQAIDIPVL